MIKEFEGKKFRTRDGKYDAEIVAVRFPSSPNQKYKFWVILTGVQHPTDRAEVYLDDLHKFNRADSDNLDLIEVKQYDWPLWCPVFAWDGENPDPLSYPMFFAGVDANGLPITFVWINNQKKWRTVLWDHAERVEKPDEL
jgi:hypothetical protein